MDRLDSRTCKQAEVEVDLTCYLKPLYIQKLVLIDNTHNPNIIKNHHKAELPPAYKQPNLINANRQLIDQYYSQNIKHLLRFDELDREKKKRSVIYCGD